jgi:hypothetical protein
MPHRLISHVAPLMLLIPGGLARLRAGDNAPQIVIESRVIEAPAGTARGILGGSTPKDGASLVASAAQTAEFLGKILEVKGAVLLSAPKVVTLSGRKATISVGNEIIPDPGKPEEVAFEGVSISLLPAAKGETILLELDARAGKKTADKPRPVVRTRAVKNVSSLAHGSTLILLSGPAMPGDSELLFIITASLAPQDRPVKAKASPER